MNLFPASHKNQAELADLDDAYGYIRMVMALCGGSPAHHSVGC